MNEPQPSNLTPPAPPASGATLPLALWLSIQLLTLCAGAAGFQLSAMEPVPPQAWAAGEMIVVQLLAAASLGPMLFATRSRLLATGLTAPPFLLAACYVAAFTPTDAWRSILVTLGWLATIACLSSIKPSAIRHLVRLTVVTTLIADVSLNYLRAEWTDRAPRGFGPISGSLAAMHHALPRQVLIADVCILLIAVAAVTASRLRGRAPAA